MNTILEEKDNIENMAAKASESIKLENMLNKEESIDGTMKSIRYLFSESSEKNRKIIDLLLKSY